MREPDEFDAEELQGTETSTSQIPDENKPIRRLFWSTIGTALGLVLLYVATRKVDLTELVGALKSADPVWIASILSFTVTFIAIKAWRWGILLRFVPNVRFGELHSAVYIGLATNFLVAHVGEFLRTTIIARHHGTAISAVFASVIVERALDFIALLILIVLAAALARDLPNLVEMAGAATAVVVIVAIVGLFLILQPPDGLARFGVTLSQSLPDRLQHWILSQLERARLGLESIKDVRLMALAITVSVLQWSLVIAAIWFSGLAVGETVSIMAATVTFILIVLGLALPNSPMQIGATQLAFTIGFGIDGILVASALAASIVYTAFLILPIMIIGGAFLIRGRYEKLSRLR